MKVFYATSTLLYIQHFLYMIYCHKYQIHYSINIKNYVVCMFGTIYSGDNKISFDTSFLHHISLFFLLFFITAMYYFLL